MRPEDAADASSAFQNPVGEVAKIVFLFIAGLAAAVYAYVDGRAQLLVYRRMCRSRYLSGHGPFSNVDGDVTVAYGNEKRSIPARGMGTAER